MGIWPSRQRHQPSTDDNQTGHKRRKRRFLSGVRRRTASALGRRSSKSMAEEPDVRSSSSASPPPKLTQTAPSVDVPDPSLPAATMLIDWKIMSQKANEKNCNLVQDQCLAVMSKDGHNRLSDDLTHEFLMQIIRCFPFPSPKPSPRSSPRSSPYAQRRRSSTNPVRNMFSSRKNNDKEDLQQSSTLSSDERQQQGWREPRESFSSMNTLKQMVVNSVDTMAITALPLDCWLKERLKHWVQLSGHEGTIVPATDKTLWKKRTGTDYSEANAYRKLMNDVVSPFCPQYTKEVEYKGESFIEIEDLTSHFVTPAIMDVKMGTRTFLEAEVKNPVKRKDLYQKMVKLAPSEPTEEEHRDQALTKLRYMQFRERQSSTASFGFRIEAMKLPDSPLRKNFQKVKTRDEVMNVLCSFLGPKPSKLRSHLLQRLRVIRTKIEESEFFRTHEVVGSSLLFMYDGKHSGIWLIDFAKALPAGDDLVLDHRSNWVIGNHEDGYLTGLDNLIQVLEDSAHKELSELS